MNLEIDDFTEKQKDYLSENHPFWIAYKYSELMRRYKLHKLQWMLHFKYDWVKENYPGYIEGISTLQDIETFWKKL